MAAEKTGPLTSRMESNDLNGFRPAWWLPGGAHGHTVWGRLVRPRRAVAFERERLETPDGDEIILDHLPGSDHSSHVLLLHGLEGSSNSVYIQGICTLLAQRGWSATVINFRSCARRDDDLRHWIPNRRPRLYHSGETGDLDFVVRTLARRFPQTRFVAFGASLGGNVLLKWLAESAGQTDVVAAVTVSVPYDLGAGARFLETSLGKFYVASFARTLREKVEGLVTMFPELAQRVDVPGLRRARTFLELDNSATAPMHGFDGALDYYTRSSSLAYLDRVPVPVLCISAADDPFLPAEVLDRFRERAPTNVELVVTEKGGHVGFVDGPFPWRPGYWAERAVMRFFEQHQVR